MRPNRALAILIFFYLLVLGGAAWHIYDRDADASSRSISKTREAVILAVNDVYRINGVAEGRFGGIARLRTLRAELEKTHPDLILLHAGDVLSPSFLSRTYHGEQMIDALNLLDGSRERGSFDPRMFVIFGNHEFDESNCESPEILRQRVMESEFTWIASNIDFAACHGHSPMLPKTDRVRNYVLIDVGGLRIGLFGLTVSFSEGTVRTQPEILPYLAVAQELTKRLRGSGADVVVALTHLALADDLALLKDLKALKQNVPDLIVGGHDHSRMVEPEGDPKIYKADADGMTASVFTIRLDENRNVQIDHHFEHLDNRVLKDPMVQQVIDHWLAKHATEFCGDKGEVDTCLDQVVGRTLLPIEAEELKNRASETGLGDWIADRMLEARPDADVAILNSGTLRLNYDMPAGATLRVRHLEELFGFPVPLLVIEVPGSLLWKALEHSLAHRGDGAWAHIAGIALTVDDLEKVERLMVRRADGRIEEVAKDSTTRYRLVTSGFLACGGDDYNFGIDLSSFGGDGKKCQREIKSKFDRNGATADLQDFVQQTVEATFKAQNKIKNGISPRANGRICEAGQQSCLIATWHQTSD